ncbi:MAG: radical SAM protein [Marivirga sp.]|nr:radical SAM protein [Marivirga sp.]
MLSRLLTLATSKIYNLPIIVMMPHSRCNCRCVMCDIWKANHDKKEISPEELQKHVKHFAALGVREIVFSGGEALMHSNLWRLCQILRENKINITLLSTGLMLERNAKEIITNFKEVIVSVDGSKDVHDKIRNIPQGFEKLSAGIRELKRLKPDYRVTARCVLQRYNFNDFSNNVKSAKEIGLDQISFLGADISTPAFNHVGEWTRERVSEVALNEEETKQFETIIEDSFSDLKEYYDSRFIVESPIKMRKIVQYYKAVNGLAEYPETVCNAPWVSAVIESDGSVMPCFFHKPYGNIYDGDFREIINSDKAIAFRKNLNVKKDPICKKCVCSLKLAVRQMN